MWLKRLQLGLIHAAVAITLVPLNSTLNRILIEDLGVLATVVVLLFAPPYLFSFIQVAIGSFADRHPILGFRRTPYILAGLLLCIVGPIAAARVALIIPDNFWAGIGFGLLTFVAWGMGFNLATVSYFSLASEISGEKGRSRTTAIMFFIMVVAIIITAGTLGRLLEDYTSAKLENAFLVVSLAALGMGLLGLLGLEKRSAKPPDSERRYSLREVYAEVRSNPQVVRFFLYLLLMLAAVLGQDALLEPFAARAFGMPVDQTTRITEVWGTFYLVSLLVTGALEGRFPKIAIARLASWMAVISFILVGLSAWVGGTGLFYIGVILLGLATGPATVSNLSIMLDMTLPGKVGLFIGAWGSASALARLLGYLVTALFRDLARLFPAEAVVGYAAGFGILAVFLVISLRLLGRLDVDAFRSGMEPPQPSLAERAALAAGSD